MARRTDLMSAGEMSRAEAVVLVQRIMDTDYASDDEVDGWLEGLGRALACPSGQVRDLIFWPPEGSFRLMRWSIRPWPIGQSLCEAGTQLRSQMSRAAVVAVPRKT